MKRHLATVALLLLASGADAMNRKPLPAPTPTPAPVIIPTTKSDAKHPPAKVPATPAVPAPVAPDAPADEWKPPAGSALKPVEAAKLLEVFRGYLGMREEPLGSNNGPMINKFNASCGFKPSDHAPWCASVTHYGYLVLGAPDRPGAYTPSWYSKLRVIPPNMVQPGDVGLVYFPSKGRYAHTIAAIEKVGRTGRTVSSYTTLEGNTTQATGSREGDGFYRRVRPSDTVTVVRWTK